MSIAKTGQGAGGASAPRQGRFAGTDAGQRPGYRNALDASRSFARLMQPESWFYLNTSISLVARGLHPVSAFKGNVCAKLGTGVRR